MPRFVLLRHQCPAGYEKPSHWDFMLEWRDALESWELQELPMRWRIALGEIPLDSTGPAAKAVRANRLADHRLVYLNYAGPLSHNRGSVSRCDQGTYTRVRETSARLEIELTGNRLQGKVLLEKDTVQKSQWRLWAEDRVQGP